LIIGFVLSDFKSAASADFAIRALSVRLLMTQDLIRSFPSCA
jgi:hypothetical protein